VHLAGVLSTGGTSAAMVSQPTFDSLVACADMYCGTAFNSNRNTSITPDESVVWWFLQSQGINAVSVNCVYDYHCTFTSSQPNVRTSPVLDGSMASMLEFANVTAGTTAPLASAMGALTVNVPASALAVGTAEDFATGILQDAMLSPFNVACDAPSASGTTSCTYYTTNAAAVYTTTLRSMSAVVSAVEPIVVSVGSTQYRGQFSTSSTVCMEEDMMMTLLQHGIVASGIQCNLGEYTFLTVQTSTQEQLQTMLQPLVDASTRGYANVSVATAYELTAEYIESLIMSVTGAMPGQIVISPVETADASVVGNTLYGAQLPVEIFDPVDPQTTYESTFMFPTGTVDLTPVLASAGIAPTNLRVNAFGTVVLNTDVALTSAQTAALVAAGASNVYTVVVVPQSGSAILQALEHAVQSGALNFGYSPAVGYSVHVRMLCNGPCTFAPTAQPTFAPTARPTPGVAATSGGAATVAGLPLMLVIIIAAVLIVLIVAVVVIAKRKKSVADPEASTRIAMENPMYEQTENIDHDAGASGAAAAGVENPMYDDTYDDTTYDDNGGYMDVGGNNNNDVVGAGDNGYLDVDQAADGDYGDLPEAAADDSSDDDDNNNNDGYDEFQAYNNPDADDDSDDDTL
jgi:hypothetical protein